MNVMKILAELRQERQQMEVAILSLERLARSREKRRGRPPAWMSNITVESARSATWKPEQGTRNRAVTTTSQRLSHVSNPTVPCRAGHDSAEEQQRASLLARRKAGVTHRGSIRANPIT